jgi:hypothetical protein
MLFYLLVSLLLLPSPAITRRILDEYKALPAAESRCKFAAYYASDVSGRALVTVGVR